MGDMKLEGASTVLEDKGYGQYLSQNELGPVLGALPAEDLKGRTFITPSELDGFVTDAVGAAKESSEAGAKRALATVQQTTTALVELKDIEKVNKIAGLLTTIGMACGAIGAMLAFFLPVVGGPLAVIGAITAGAAQLIKWNVNRRYKKKRTKLVEKHQAALVELLAYRQAKTRRDLKQVNETKLPDQPNNGVPAGGEAAERNVEGSS